LETGNWKLQIRALKLVLLAGLSAYPLCAQEPSDTRQKPSNAAAPVSQTQKPPEKPPKTPEQPKAPPAPGQIQLQAPTEAPAEPGKTAPPQAAPEQPQQRIIEDINFHGNRRIPAATLRARIFSHKGDAYDENALERDLHALWNTGFFDDIRVEASDGPKGGKIVAFYVREKKLIRQIDYKGLSTVSQSDALDRFKERKVGLSIESQYDPVVIKHAEVVLEQLLAEHGRQFASAKARTRNIPPNSVALTFIVVEGPKVKVGRISFRGNKVFSGPRLERAMKYSRPSGAPPWFYWFHKTYDKEKIEADLENIRELYQDNGYFYALASEPTTKMVDTQHPWPLFFLGRGRGKRVDITIPIEEGAQYRLGRFVIRGNKLFKQELLTRVLQLKTGDIFNLSKVRKSLENYKKLYGQFGYINFTAEPDINPDRKKHIINLALDFEEDKQYFVHRIEFSGNTKTRDKVIRRELLLEEGGVFATNYWDLSVLKINQLGFFDEIKKEDYEIKQNIKDSTVDILVKVKEKGKNSIGFSGGVSGYAGTFVGINYATNNFLGLGETLSLQFEVGTYQKLYSFGFTEPYLADRPITTGFTIFKSSYNFNQARQLALFSGVNPSALQNSLLGQFYLQNFQQNSSGFTAFASYPLRRTFARVGLTYSFTVNSIQTFNAASQLFYSALSFQSLQGPNSLNGITESQIMPTYLYNTVDRPLDAHSGKYLYAALGFSGLGGNVNTIRPTFEGKYFHPVNKKRNVIGLHLLASTILGYAGKVPPPYSRFYLGGEYDLRGFDIRSISPIAWFPTTTTVCNRDAAGNIIPALNATGQKTGSCGSSTQFPIYTPIFPGGDTEAVSNFEYRVPIAGPVTVAYFIDAGTNFIAYPSQLKVNPSSFYPITKQFPYFPTLSEVKPIAGTNFHPYSSTGLELQVILPIVNAPFRVFWGYNWLTNNAILRPPQQAPPMSLFPNQATYNSALVFFQPYRFQERRSRVGFTVARTF
jgi:outer membrane protein insertion porin family